MLDQRRWVEKTDRNANWTNLVFRKRKILQEDRFSSRSGGNQEDQIILIGVPSWRSRNVEQESKNWKVNQFWERISSKLSFFTEDRPMSPYQQNWEENVFFSAEAFKFFNFLINITNFYPVFFCFCID